MPIIDLSFPIRPHFRWKVEPTLRSSHARGDIFQSTILTITCHAYTHVDAPVHFLPGDRDIASMPVDQWIGEAAVVDLTHLGDNGEVSAGELDARASHVRRGDIVLLRTDWPRKVSVETEKFWRDAAGSMIEQAFAAAARSLVGMGFTRMIVAGGETAGAVVNGLGVTALEIGPEIDPGVPWTRSIGGTELALALKSGNFGAPDFFLKAWDRLA